MKRQAIVLLVMLLYHYSDGQDFRILQKDKGKLFISTVRSGDSLLQVAIINADWRLDYVQKNITSYTYTANADQDPEDSPDSVITKPKHRFGRIGIVADEHRYKEQLAHTFYIDMANTTSVNEIFRLINEGYRNVSQTDDDYSLIKNFLPDSATEYYVDAYKGTNNAGIEIMYLWGAPLRGWSIGFSITVHDREARRVLNSILCMGPNDTELEARKVKMRQANLLAIRSYSEIFFQ